MKTNGLQQLVGGCLALVFAVGCSSGGDGGTDPTGTITLLLNPPSATVAQGGQTQVTGTLTRGGGFTGTVTFSVEGHPATVTATVSNIQTVGTVTTATVTLQVGATTTLGLHTITVRGKATGLADAPAQFQLTVTEAPNFSVGVNPPSASMVQGTNRSDIVVTLTRTNFTDPVTLSLAPGTVVVPAGVTASFAPAAPTGTSSALTLTIGAAAAPGTYGLSITGTGSLGTRTTPFSLTITAAGSFTLGITPPPSTVMLQQGTSDNSKTITIIRTNYTPAVTLTAENLPGGVTASFAGNPVAGNSSVLTLTATAGATVGVPVTVTIRGTGPAALRGPGAMAGLEAITTLALTVTAAPAPGNVIVDFSGCPAETKAAWLAYQDGTTAPFIRVTGVNDVYQFNITLSKGGVAWVTLQAGSSSVSVQYFTQAELTAGPMRICPSQPARETVNGSVANLPPNFQARVFFAGSGTTNLANGPFQLNFALDGSYDLVGYMRQSQGGGSGDRGFIDRGLNPPNGGSVGTVDFQPNEPKAFAAAGATASVTGLASGQTFSQSMTFNTGTGATACTPAELYFEFGIPGPTFPLYGIPATRQVAGDVHSLQISTSGGTVGFRQLTENFTDLVARAASPFVLPQPLPVPAINNAGGPYKRLTATVLNASPELNQSALFMYAGAPFTGQQVVITASYGWLGGFSFSLPMPDFTGVAGWDNTWAPGPSNQVSWSVSASGSNQTGGGCSAGRRFVTVERSGTA